MARRTPPALRFQTGRDPATKRLPVGKKRIVSIERLSSDGRGIAFIDGHTWFVSGALADEQVEARVLSVRGRIVEAITERVLSASSERQLPACRHAGYCGGCTLQHVPHSTQLVLKQRLLAEQLTRIGGIELLHWAEPVSGDALAYRRRARIAVRWNAADRHLSVGFRAQASQRIVDIEHCPVLVQPLQKIMAALPACLRGFRKPWAIGHLELFSTDRQVLLLRYTQALADDDLGRLRAFCLEQGLQLWLQGETEPYADAQETGLCYPLPMLKKGLAYRPGDFIQVNGLVNERMVAQALDWLEPSPSARVLDLFCGLGNFSLPLAGRVAEVVGVEGSREMVERASRNAERNGLRNVRFFQADLAQGSLAAEWMRDSFDAVLLDPPRDGALVMVRQMERFAPRRVLYISCNPATLARDAVELVRQGFVLSRTAILDMFPQTSHVEAMALFEKA